MSAFSSLPAFVPCCVLVVCMNSSAATRTDVFCVTARVASGCTVRTGPAPSLLASPERLHVHCTQDTPHSIALSFIDDATAAPDARGQRIVATVSF